MYNRCKCQNNHCCNSKNTDTITEINDSNKCDEKCKCGFESDPTVFPENYMYGQSYVPIQYLDKVFKPEVGLKMGTIFPELVSPYSPGQSMEENEYIRNKTRNEGKCSQIMN